MDFGTLLQSRLFDHVNGKLAADVELVMQQKAIGGEFLLKLTLEIYSYYCDYFKRTQGRLFDTMDVKPNEARQIALGSIKAYISTICDRIQIKFDLDALSAEQQSTGLPTYLSIIMSTMILADVIQDGHYGLGFTTLSTAIDDFSKTKTDSLTPKSRRRLLDVFKKN